MKSRSDYSAIEDGLWKKDEILAANTAASTARSGKKAGESRQKLEECPKNVVQAELERAQKWRGAYEHALETGRLFNPNTNQLKEQWPLTPEPQANFKALLGFTDAFIRRCEKVLAGRK